MKRCAIEAKKFSNWLVPIVGNRNGEFAAEVAAREGLGFGEHSLIVAGEEQFAAEFSGAGAEIDDVVGGTDGVRIMFDDEDGVAKVAEGFEDVDEALGVARVQADGRLVKNIKSTDEMGA